MTKSSKSQHPPDDSVTEAKIVAFYGFWQCQAVDTRGFPAAKPAAFTHEGKEGRTFLGRGDGETGVVLLDIDLGQPAVGRVPPATCDPPVEKPDKSPAT